jgi:hypothetical protein
VLEMSLTVGELRKIIEGLDDTMPVLYAWTWRSPDDICLGSYMQATKHQCLLFDGDTRAWEKSFGNKVLWRKPADEV